MYSEAREQVYSWLRDCLIGPSADDGARLALHALHRIRPLDRYQTAILFPISSGDFGLDAGDPEADPDADEDGRDGGRPSVSAAQGGGSGRPLRKVVPPSSVGFSFFVQGDAVEVQLVPRALRYQQNLPRDEVGRFGARSWQPVALGGEQQAVTCTAPAGARGRPARCPVFDERAELLVLWRRQQGGWLVTVSLSNRQRVAAGPARPAGAAVGGEIDALNEKALFAVQLDCYLRQGVVGPYPRADSGLLSAEERELELRYRRQVIYAVGHGAAVDWRLRDGRVSRFRSEFLPRVEVPRVDPDAGKGDGAALVVDDLAAIVDRRGPVCAALDGFVAGYTAWIGAQDAMANGLATDDQPTATQVVARMRTAAERMRAGIQRLRDDPVAARAFALANAAMASQMRQARRRSGTDRGPFETPCWRPFQLAFLLMAIESSIDEDAADRDILDLIWFPTGGGKTEAYLGLMAFVIGYRRLKYGATGGGTTVLMRYTLRLLTKDQFRRAARLICALELMRRERPGELGAEPITAGLWVGGASSPNHYQDARAVLEEAIESGQDDPPALLVLEVCPWCGAPFQTRRNFAAGPRHFHFRCTSPHCEFGADGDGLLPCNVVDAALYDAPPTLLLATVDKFARLAWEARTGAFFGLDGNRPPELIIQDELHLIAGALGSVAGLYEAGLDTVLQMRGMRPKYIASTATIRMAAQQVERLYGRRRLYGHRDSDRQAAVFPPPGLDADDAYFARTLAPTDRKPGRLYVGYLAPARNRQRCLAPLAAALLAAPEALFGNAGADREDLLDAWWTPLVYHGSLKGVGVSRNALREVQEWIERLQQEAIARQMPADRDPPAEDQTANKQTAPWRDRLADRITQLTSHMSAQDNARGFERLAKPRGDPDALDLALATNMVSVGLDVSRLAAMVINGQPLTTAEYIQASSRVGRGAVPGIVVANYFRDQARSLSHYESFRAYHEAFYRFVEPTSVTPYTYQARLRALHVALVIAVRHCGGGLAANDRAGAFDPQRPVLAEAIELLVRRCRDADAERGAETEAHLRRLVQQWADTACAAAEQKQGLVYSESDRDRRHLRLLYSHQDRCRGEWVTLHNMRNVENTAVVKIL